MSIIKKVFKNMDEASTFQNKLYEKYNIVRLIDFPRSSDYGLYVWEVQ